MSAAMGSLVVSLEANIAKFTSDMGRAAMQMEMSMRQMQRSADITRAAIKNLLIGSAVALTGGGLVASIQSAIDTLAKLDDMAQKTGSSVENLSRLEQVAASTGAAFEGVDGALTKLSKGLATVDQKGSDTADALKAIGISQADIKNQDPSQVFVMIARHLQNYKDGAGKVAIANTLMGKSGAEMLPYLNDVAEKIDRFTGHSSDAAKNASEFQDSLGLLKVEITNVATEVASGALPALTEMIKVFSDTKNSTEDMRTFGEQAALVIAQITDAVTLAANGFSAVTGSFRVVAADIDVFFTNSVTNKAGYEKALAERNTILKNANNAWEKLLGNSVNKYEDAAKKLIEINKNIKLGLANSGSDHRFASLGAPTAKPDLTAPDKKTQEAAEKSARDAQRRIDDNYAQQTLALSKDIAKSETIIANIKKGVLEDEGQHVAAVKQWLEFDKEGIALDKKRKDNLLGRASLADQLAVSAKMEKQHAEFMLAAGVEQLKSARDIAAIRKTGEGSRYTAAADFSASDAGKKMWDHDPAKYMQEWFTKISEDENAKSKVAASYLYSLDQQNKSIGRQIQLLGMSAQEQESQQALWQAEDEFRRATIGMAEDDLKYQELKTGYLQQQSDLIEQIANQRAMASDPWVQSGVALKNYADDAANLGKQISSAWTGAFKGMEDAMVKFAQTGKLQVKDMANSIIADLIRIAVRQSITAPIAAGLAGLFSGAAVPSNANTTIPMQPGGGYATGGYIAGPGTATSDSIPAWLSNGEYVVKASAVDRVGVDFLDAINSGRSMRRYATGGVVGTVAPSGKAAIGNMQVNVINPPGVPLEATTSAPRFDGEKMVVDVVLKRIATDAKFRQAVRG